MGGAAAGRATRRCGYRLLRTYATHGKSKAPGGTDQPVPTPTGSAAMPSVASASTPTSTAVPIGKPLGSAQASAASAQQGTASAPGSAGAPHQAKAAATQGSGAGSIGSASKTPGPAPSGTTSLGSSTSRPIPAPATGSGAAGAPAPGQTLPSGISTAGKPAQQFYKGGGRAPGGPGQLGHKNAWLLAPWFPIDVRVLGGSLLAAAAAYYYMVSTTDEDIPGSKGSGPSGMAPERDLNAIDGERRDANEQEADCEAGAQQQDGSREDEQVEARSAVGERHSTFYSDEAAMSSEPAQPSSTPQAAQEQLSQQHQQAIEAAWGRPGKGSVSEAGGPTGGDSKGGDSKVGTQAGVSAADEAAAKSKPTDSNSGKVGVVSLSADKDAIYIDPTPLMDLMAEALSAGQGLQRQGQAAEDNSLGSQERAPQSDSGSASRGADAARVKTLQETVQVMKVAMADSAGEAAFSHEHHPPPPQDKGKAIGQIPQAAGAPAPPAPSRAPVAPQAAAAEAAAADDHAAAVQRQLGITDDLSPAALVRKAIERGEGAGDDWAEYAHRLRQAELDADVIRAVLGRVAAHHQGEVAKVQAVADGHAQRVRDAASKAQAIVNHFTQVLEEQQRLADAQRENELKRQAEYMAVAAAEAAVQERRLRGEELDKVRIKLNALGQAFSQRSQERHTSHTAHKLALGTFALESALCQGQPFEEALRLLARGCEGDDLVYAAIRALPKETAEQGIPTRAQLQDRWADVARAARSLAALPEGAGGPLSLGLASLAAKLKVSERGCAGQAGRQSGSVDSALAEAEGHLANGRPAAAGAALQRGVAGTAAAPVVQDWAEAAWARGVADQTLALLQAHATSQAASLS